MVKLLLRSRVEIGDQPPSGRRQMLAAASASGAVEGLADWEVTFRLANVRALPNSTRALMLSGLCHVSEDTLRSNSNVRKV